jgi:hypothetical protein
MHRTSRSMSAAQIRGGVPEGAQPVKGLDAAAATPDSAMDCSTRVTDLTVAWSDLAPVPDGSGPGHMTGHDHAS